MNQTTANKTTNRFLANAFWIIAGRIAQALLNFFVNMYSARYLGPSNYGLIGYATSTIAFFLPLAMLGYDGILVLELVEHPEKEGEILGSTLGMSSICSILCSLLSVLVVSIINPGETDTLIITGVYSVSMLFQSLGLTNYWFQKKLLSKYTSLVSLLAYIAISAYKIFLLITGQSVVLFALAHSIDLAVIAFSLLIIYKKLGTQKLSFSIQTAIRIFKRSKHFILPAIMVTIFTQTDRLMLKLMLDNSATGIYNAAVTCAGVATFIINAIIDSARPLIFESVGKSTEDFQHNMTLLYSITIYFCFLQSLGTLIIAPILIKVIYGDAYLGATSVLRVITWYIPFSTLGNVRNIWLVACKKQQYLLPINSIGGLVNIILNFFLIRLFGATGAALATIITQFTTNVVVGWIIAPMRENNRLMLAGCNPKYLYLMLKQTLNKRKSSASV